MLTDLRNGRVVEWNLSLEGNVTSNCGIYQITGFRARVYHKSEAGGWNVRYETFTSELIDEVFDAIKSDVIKHIVKTAYNILPGMIVLSTGIAEGYYVYTETGSLGSARHKYTTDGIPSEMRGPYLCYNTKNMMTHDLMVRIVQGDWGSFMTSPIIRNESHAVGDSGIMLLTWMPGATFLDKRTLRHIDTMQIATTEPPYEPAAKRDAKALISRIKKKDYYGPASSSTR